MRRLVAGGVLFAFMAVFGQAPWAHVHEHHYDPTHDSDHAAMKIHGHGFHHSGPGAVWRALDADDDARLIGQMTVVRDGASLPDLTSNETGLVGPVERVSEVKLEDTTPRSHGPPGLDRLIPRAPPA